MNPDLWAEVERLYHAALEREPQDRMAFLARTSPHEEVRREVESLLRHDGDRLLSDPPWWPKLGPSLAAGTRLGPYEIISSIGVGGMGEVYRARDTSLGRDVAIKVLPDAVAQDPDRLARFNREAKMLAALNHQNIAHVYGVESKALVMELVEGETLSSLLKPGPLPIETALDYAKQVAVALEAAHEKGIVHRDLKPANVMVTPAGLVKVLDFGLAKVDEPPSGDPATSPTATQSPTRAGLILGTAAYMSPEQASGKAVDRRADIWSFGAVLYEMLSGQQAFAGESVTEILAAVLRGEPAWSALPEATPLSIRKLLRRCLERDRTQRLQAIGEARIEIEAALAEEPVSDSTIKRHKKTAIGSVAVVALVVLTWFLLHRPPQTAADLTQKRLTFNSSENLVLSEAISPDGKYLAYSDPAGIHVKLLSTSEERLIPMPSGLSGGASWSVDSWFPDSAQLLADVSQTNGHKSIWTISVLGQSPRQLREDAEGFAVSPDGTHIAFQRAAEDDDHGILVIGVQGDNPRKVLAVGANDWLYSVRWSPGGQRLAYVRMHLSSDRLLYSIETSDLKGSSRTVIVSAELLVNDFCWLPDGWIVYARQDSLDSSDVNLWQIGIDNRSGTPTGKSKRITQWPGSELFGLSASADGKRMGLLKATTQSQVYLAELAAAGTRMKPPRRLINDEANDSLYAWTADSKAVLFDSERNGTLGIYKQGINQGTSELLVTGPQNVRFPRLSSDGAWILFVEILRAAVNFAAPQRLMRVHVDGGAPRVVLETGILLNYDCARAPASLCVIAEASQDRKQLLITAFDPLKGRGKVLRTIETSPLHVVQQSGLSPDGSTFAMSRIDEAEIHIRLLSLSGGSDREIVVKGWPSLTNLDWSNDGKGLYCGSNLPKGSTLLYVDLKGNARVLWQYKAMHGGMSGIPSPDGRYLAISGDVSNSHVWMIEGF